MSAPSLKRFRVLLTERFVNEVFVEASDADAAQDEALRLWEERDDVPNSPVNYDVGFSIDTEATEVEEALP